MPRAITLAAVIAYATLAAYAFHGEQLFVRAENGSKTVSDYEILLARAYNRNRCNADVAMRYVQVMLRHGNDARARSVITESALEDVRWQGWELMGTVQERQAFSDAGILADAEEAAKLYDRVLAVYPVYERGLEKRGLLALKMGDWESVQYVANKLLMINASNSNATYFRARMAEGVNDHRIAFDAYASLSSLGGIDPGALYSQRELVERLNQLEKVIDK